MVTQLINVSIRPEQRDRWLEVIRMNAAQTRAEEGCESALDQARRLRAGWPDRHRRSS
jgi:hypothetical protein